MEDQATHKVERLFRKLDLMGHYPQKLSLNDALCIRPEMLGKEQRTDSKELYLHLLQMIMAYHHKCRTSLCVSEEQLNSFMCNSTDEASDSFDDLFDNAEEEESVSDHNIHPMDSLIALLHCADDFLRQDLMARLVTCQLSIPLLLPDPFTGKLILPLWAMRSIVKEWKSTMKGSEGIHECPLISYATPIVAFVRFGRQEKSKSKIMNQIISDCNHDHFFHRDCEGGHFDRLLGEGLVELCWYLPAGKENDAFPDAIMFVNLHGDARKHQKQIAFLSETCFMAFVLFSEDLDEDGVSVIKALSSTPGGIILLLCSNLSASKKLSQLKGEISDKLDGYKLLKKNDDMIKRDLRFRINKKFEQKWDTVAKIQMQRKLKETACALDILTDGTTQEFIDGQTFADNICTIISQKALDAKQIILPLQGEKLWQAWAKLDKEEHRPIAKKGRRVEDYSEEKSQEKKKVRKMQLQQVKNPSNPLMSDFVTFLCTNSERCQNYFLQCVKLVLNDLSRMNITKLQFDCKQKRAKLLEVERAKDDKAVAKCREEIKELHEKINEASLGLEHLLREIGQIYEATCWQSSPVDEKYLNLPHTVARLFTNGYPLELMDGDAAHVPEKWIQAVMQEAICILKDPKVFVLSVLGLQSTGKSTLMNTAFGLQFNVSAGRCTRGAYMQLLPISESLSKETHCDYVLVVDTEGLRAPELDSQKMQKHDNELATFVTGLANVTMINIYGEVPGDMDDILQTTVHAFLRMKHVKLNPSCQFIHQNVSSVTASDRGEMGRSRFKQKLDIMTAIAAKEEECENKFKFFSDVITFNSETDVHHFPGLWNGNPPMAPVNEGYSNKALGLKSHLVEMMRDSKSKSEKLSEVTKRIGALWKALLNENFIFSFRNTLEISVYNDLDAKFIQWARKMKREMCEWETEREAEIKGQNEDQLQAFKRRLINTELPAYVISMSESIKKEMKEYFAVSDHPDVLIQWEKDTENRLKQLTDQLQEMATKYFTEIISHLQAINDANSSKSRYRVKLTEKIKLLVDGLDKAKFKRDTADQSQIEKKLKELFEDVWKILIEDVKRTVSVEKEIDIEAAVQITLADHFRSEQSILYSKLKCTSLREWGKILGLEETLTREHVNFKQGFVELTKDKLTGKPRLPEFVVEIAKSRAKEACKQVERYLNTLSNQKFHPDFTSEVLSIVDRVISTCSPGQNFTFTKVYKITVSLTACGYAVRKFERMLCEFRKQNDPIEYLETKAKCHLFGLFKDQYFQTGMEKVAASTCCELLSSSIEQKIIRSLYSELYARVSNYKLPQLTHKRDLKKRVLLDLGRGVRQQSSPDLTDYMTYISNASTSLREWIRHYVKDCSDSELSRLRSLAEKKLEDEIKILRDKIETVTVHDDNFNSITWLMQICSACCLVVDTSEFKDFGGDQPLKDIDSFKLMVISGVNSLKLSLGIKFNNMTIDMIERRKTPVYEYFCDDLLGCCEQCPFCQEQCDKTYKYHSDKHTCRHRPQCLGSYHDSVTKEMTIGVCNSLVGSNQTFQCSDTQQRCVNYSDYSNIYPKWSITPDMSADSSWYWKWFLGKYSRQIAHHFEINAGSIPSSWKALTWRHAEYDVNYSY